MPDNQSQHCCPICSAGFTKSGQQKHQVLSGQDLQVQRGPLFLSQHDWVSDSTPVTSFHPVLIVQPQAASETDGNSILMPQSGSYLPQDDWPISYHSPSLSLLTPKPTFPRMRLCFLARLTSSHGLANSFNCDNICASTKTHSDLLQYGSRPSPEPVAIPGMPVTSPWSPKLIAALSLIGASLSPDRKHHDQAMMWLETVENWIFQDPDFSEDSIAQTDDDGQDCQVRQRLNILQAAYGILLLMNWEGDTKMRLRARRKRFPDIVFVSRSLYPFAMPGTREEAYLTPHNLHDHWTAFGLREELIRTLLYTFLLDSAFVIFYDMSPQMVINELQFGLAATDEHFDAPDAETWFMYTQAAAERSLGRSQVTLSQCITMIMGEDFGTSRWEVFETISPLNLFAIASEWTRPKVKVLAYHTRAKELVSSLVQS
ncbi:uncharacterized protein FSUBG_9298 [Fusarium subglutinans]|uniref:Transcription factor domain-containing protein n=1 Tax=Gibberella subglutinans TaxID=42677 RepID=A0A8H5PDW0_GIBSU|nr:uncharacterized protein FSUBG_9298 [Fusarium subglutinans]KAF5594912.1 hypothetical protein FSUBG_9298 [Fusarium subglutinans]